MTSAVLALGSNLGDRAANLQAAVALLRERGFETTAASSPWETPPMPADQPAFLNAAIAGETDLPALELLAAAKAVERLLGRRPGRRWGPRPIDVDILFFGDERIDLPELRVPHALLGERAFVLAPLAEVVPGVLPVLGRRAIELLAEVDATGVVRTGGRLL
ncbi:MAG: 2-amino-4-hydroxy-6-hydroxymethyldihydropteridine diphosphokinase [Chloroflexi bacterium]|nr:2-amino-4-hydroxy-6-hydroxymethyldihydropteridine diphosphokinase [Chloroflexota bacterium]